MVERRSKHGDDEHGDDEERAHADDDEEHKILQIEFELFEVAPPWRSADHFRQLRAKIGFSHQWPARQRRPHAIAWSPSSRQ